MNEFIFLLQTVFIAITSLSALAWGKEALACFICLMSIFANIFVAKQIALFGLHVTATDSLSIGVSLGLNLMQEYFGKSAARKIILLSLGAGLLCTILSVLHLGYTPSLFDVTQEHYKAIFGIMPRIMIASYATYLIVQYTETILYAWLQKKIPTLLVLRNIGSIACCQMLDTVLFSFLGLYGSVEHLSHIIALSFTIKMIVLSCCAPFLWFSKKIIPSMRVQLS